MVSCVRDRVRRVALLALRPRVRLDSASGPARWCTRHPSPAVPAAAAVVAAMIAVDLIPPSVEPAVTDLAVLVPTILGAAAILVGVSRWHARWLRGQIVAVLDERLGGLAASVDRVDRAVNHQPDGAPTLAAQVAALTIAGADRAGQVAAVARQLAAHGVLVRDISDRLADISDRLAVLERPDPKEHP